MQAHDDADAFAAVTRHLQQRFPRLPEALIRTAVDAERDRLIEAGKAVGEQVWRLPLADSYDRDIDSDAADVKNIGGGRAAGSIIAAQFLQRFIDDVPWAHLDIAGTAWSTKDTATVPKGATAFGVRLLDRLVSQYYEKK